MAYRSVLPALVAKIKSSTAIAAVVGGKVYLGAALQSVAPPFVVVELVTQQREHRTQATHPETGQLVRVRREVSVFLLKTASPTAEGADTLAGLLDDLLDAEEGSPQLEFDVANAQTSSSLIGDYTIGVDPEKAPDGSPVYVGVVEYALALTRWKPVA